MSIPFKPDSDESSPPSDNDAAEATEPLKPANRDDRQPIRDQISGVTTEHAFPPRLEDEGQPGG